MVGRWAYDLLYRRRAPWEGPPRAELVGLVESGRLVPGRAVDLGCGSGANAIFLAEHGFDVVGVDFSPVALAKAERAAAESTARERVRFIRGDLTADVIHGLDGTFDLVVDYGTLDDLRGAKRRAMAAWFPRLVRPGGHALLWCFYGPFDGLPWFSLTRQSRLAGGLAVGEEQDLFAADFSIERLPEPPPGSHLACFLMKRVDARG